MCPRREVTNELLIIIGMLNLQTTAHILWWLQLHRWTNLWVFRHREILTQVTDILILKLRKQQMTLHLMFQLSFEILRERRGTCHQLEGNVQVI